MITEERVEAVAQFEEVPPETETNGFEALVIKSWSKVKAIENYDEVAGKLLFKRFAAKL